MPANPPDVFDTAGIRARVIAGWAASPTRFREDANAEEDYALGGYRDRLIVELAQNAADAAARAGEPGVLRLSLVDGELRAANTGAPLDADGVRSLASLRASAKRGTGSVGRFGVGFAAVLSVTDAPAVLSANGGVRFSAADTARELAGIDALQVELRRRSGAAPVLRLPWPVAGLPPAGFSTEVRLPLRPGAAEAAEVALDEVDASILLALPGLERIEIGARVLRRSDDGPTVTLTDGDASSTWRIRRSGGTIPAALLADRPTEERDRDQWAITWAVPVDADGAPVPVAGPGVVHAPTPTAEPLSLPARLIATLPLEASRRRVEPGPLADHLIDRAGAEYAALLESLPGTPGILALVPRTSLAGGSVDAALVAAATAHLRDARLLPALDGRRITGSDATVLDLESDGLVGAVADAVDGLLGAPWSARPHAGPLGRLGVRRLATADAVDLLAALDRPAPWWQRLYAALADTPDAGELAGLPVPLVDGRTVTGPRGTLLPDADLPATTAILGLRIVDPAAAHPLLERLGALPATARTVLADDRVRAAVLGSYDAEDPEPIATAVLDLVRAAGIGAGEFPWLAELALPTADGDWRPAGELLLPGSALAAVMAADAPFATPSAQLVSDYAADVLEAVGVLSTFAVIEAEDVSLDPDDPGLEEIEVDGIESWVAWAVRQLPAGAVPPRVDRLAAVRDLELVAPDAWPAALELIGAGPLHRAVTEPARLRSDGGEASVASYTRWWLSTHPVLDGRRPDRSRLPEATELAGLYDVAASPWAALAGARTGLAEVLADLAGDPDGAADLLDLLGDADRRLDPVLASEIYARIATALGDRVGDVEPPGRVRTGPDRTAPAADAVVLDAPYALPLLGAVPIVAAGGAAEAVADLLDLPLASERIADARVSSTPVRTAEWATQPGVELAAARCHAQVPAGQLAWHDPLLVDGSPVSWWPAAGTDHVDVIVGPAALGRALAWRLEAWPRRAAATEALAADGQTTAAEDAAE